MELYQTYTLSNGLQIAHLATESPVSYCGFAVNAATRDEEIENYGMAHFIEHMLFKGTQKRKAWHILNRMDSVGGELNAFTTKEETILYSVFMEEHFERAFELLSDMIFNASFPSHEIERELGVILDEIDTIDDSPSEKIYDQFENLIFKNHPMGHDILGSAETLRTFTTETALAFTKRYYRPDNLLFFSMGRTPFKKIIKYAERLLGSIEMPTTQKNRTIAPLLEPQTVNIKSSTNQSHVIIGSRAFEMQHNLCAAQFLLSNLLGGSAMNSRLNLILREKRGWAYQVESNVNAYTDCGVFNIYFATAPKYKEKSMLLVKNELDRLCQNQLTEKELNALKKQTIGQLCLSIDNRDSVFLGFGKTRLHTGKYYSQQSQIERIKQISAADLQEVARTILDPKKCSTLIYEPEEIKK